MTLNNSRILPARALVWVLAFCLLALGPISAMAQDSAETSTTESQETKQDKKARKKAEREARIKAWLDKKRAEENNESADDKPEDRAATSDKAKDKDARVKAFLDKQKEKEAKQAEKARLEAERAEQKAQAKAQAQQQTTDANAAPAVGNAEAIQRGKEAMARDRGEEADTPANENNQNSWVAEQDKKKKKRSGRRSRGSSARIGGRGSLKSTQQMLMNSTLGEDPRIRSTLEAIEAGEASVTEISTLANNLAYQGMLKEAEVYYGQALKLDPDNAQAWTNLGTIQQRNGDHSAAMQSFARSIRIAPNVALTHYNMGISLAETNQYDEAIEEFKMALLLDPKLADPEVNPHVVHNDLLLPVQLELYQQSQGSNELPLLPVRENNTKKKKR